MEFDFNRALAEWRRELAQQKGISPEYRNELESSLHDHYDEQLIRGLNPAAAFKVAIDRVKPSKSASTQLPVWLLLLPNNLKIAVRNLRRKAGYGIVNFLCLALGMITVTIAALYLDYEMSFDKFVPEHDQKYRLARTYRSQNYSVVSFRDYYGTEGAVQLDQLREIEATPGVVSATQFFVFEGPTFVRRGEQRFPVENILQTNTPNRFTDFFGWEFKLGSAASFGEQPYTALLTENEALRLYGANWQQQSILGNPIRIDTVDYTLAGVIANVPSNSHYDFTMALHQPKIEYWGCRFYVELSSGTDPNSVTQLLDDNIGNINPQLADDELFGGVILQPISSIHLHSDLLYEMKPPGDIRYLYIIGIIGLIILLLTIGNYTNLAIAMNFGRRREIGMRKTFGAKRTQIAGQFVLEALLLCLLAVPVVGLLLWWLLPHFNQLMGTGISTDSVLDPTLWYYLLGVSLLTGFLASLYPAISLSGRSVLTLFRGTSPNTSAGKLSMRKLIIGCQFILLIGLTSLTFFVNRQLAFLQNQDVGYVKEGVLYASVNTDSTGFEAIKAELLTLPNVTDVGSDGYMGTTPYNQTTYQLSGQSDVFDDAHLVSISYDAARILGIRSSEQASIDDPTNAPERIVLVNTTLADKLRQRYQFTPEQLRGQSIILEPEYTDEESGQIGFPLTIDGTFEDINMFSLRQRVEPMVLTLRRSPAYTYWATIGFSGIEPAKIREQVRELFQRKYPDQPFIHAFLRDNLAELYAAEERIARLSIFFSLVAFFVALIGLIALTAFLTTLRKKEIGIRKILGASHLEILHRFNWEYIPLVGIALLIAAPITFYGLQRWLAGFAYRIELQPWVFIIAAVLTLIVTIVGVSIVSLRAASNLPIRALRDDQ
ncbi:MAG: FtsX-like permease family protein [Bacteroidota bacterium]